MSIQIEKTEEFKELAEHFVRCFETQKLVNLQLVEDKIQSLLTKQKKMILKEFRESDEDDEVSLLYRTASSSLPSLNIKEDE